MRSDPDSCLWADSAPVTHAFTRSPFVQHNRQGMGRFWGASIVTYFAYLCWDLVFLL
jgi:hypothetical protein